MKFECCGNNLGIYATNLRQNKSSKKLTWDSSNGADALIVQTAYGEAVEMGELCRGLEEKIEKIEMLQGKYVRILPTVWCRYISSIEKAKSNGCTINGEPATYTVFACVFDRNTGSGKIYESQNDGMIKPCCDIQVQFHIDVIKELEIKGLFRKHEVDTGFYSLNFPEVSYGGYMDGDLFYCVAGLEVPITKEMFERRKVYVKTAEEPEVKSKNKGLCLL